ncbi:MAG: tetratricopeptide repeat protein [Aureliella sp.]
MTMRPYDLNRTCSARHRKRPQGLQVALVLACMLLGRCPTFATTPNDAVGFGVPAVPQQSVFDNSAAKSEDNPSIASDETAAERKERLLTERFQQVLMKRPRRGTALDKVYGYHVATGNIENFLKKLKTSATEDANSAAWTILGLIHSARGNDLLAVEAFQQSVALSDSDAMAWYYLGQSQLQVGALKDATASLQRSIAQRPSRVDSLPIFETLGRVFLRNGKRNEAIEIWAEMERQFPDDSQVQELIARTLSEEGQYEEALSRYKKLKDSGKDPYRRIENALRYTDVLLSLDRRPDALQELEALVGRVNPSSWLRRELRNRIESVLLADPNPSALTDYYRDWLASRPEDVEARNRLASVLINQQRYPEARQQLKQLIAQNPTDPSPRLTLVELYEREDAPTAAAEQVEALLELDATNPDWILLLGELKWLASGRDVAARPLVEATWQRLIDSYPDEANYAAIVAEKLISIGSTDQAEALFERAIRLAPEDLRYRRQLGNLLLKAERRSDAISVWKQIAAPPRDSAENMLFAAEILRTNEIQAESTELLRAASEKELSVGQRISVARLLLDTELFAEALEQLQKAFGEAEAQTQRRQILDELSQLHGSAGTLTNELERVAGWSSDSEPLLVDDALWQPEERAYYHALLHEANGNTAAATRVLDRATDDFPESGLLLQFAAKLAEERGQLAEAIEVYDRLSRIERVTSSQHLERKCLLELQLQRFDDAMTTAAKRAALAPRNLDYSGFQAEVCFMANRREEAIQILRRRLRQAPRDTSAIGDLARTLANSNRDEEAIEIYWRLFNEQTTAEERSATIIQMAGIYWRQQRFTNLLTRIDATAEELNQPESAYLWKASAHRAVSDVGTALQMLNQLARVRTDDPALLRQLARLYADQGDYEQAFTFQLKLLDLQITEERIKDTVEIAIQAEELSKANAILEEHIELLSDQTKYQIASQFFSFGDLDATQILLDRYLEGAKPHWELVLLAALNEFRRGNLTAAEAHAKRVLAAGAEFESASLSNAYQQPRQSIGSQVHGKLLSQSPGPSIVLENQDQFRELLSAGAASGWGYGGWGYGFGGYGYSGRNSISSIGRKPIYLSAMDNYGVGMSLCWAILFECQPEAEQERWATQAANQMVGLASRESLWMAYFLQTWAEPFNWYDGEEVPPQLQVVVDALLAEGDAYVASTELYRFRQFNLPDDPFQSFELRDEQVDELLKLADMIVKSTASAKIQPALDATLAVLLRSQRLDAARDFLQKHAEHCVNPDDRIWLASQLVRLPYFEESNGRSGEFQAELARSRPNGRGSGDRIDSKLRVAASEEALQHLISEIRRVRESNSPRAAIEILDDQISLLTELDYELPTAQLLILFEVWLEERIACVDGQPLRTLLPYSLTESSRGAREIASGIRFPNDNAFLPRVFLREWSSLFEQFDASDAVDDLANALRRVAANHENAHGRFFSLAVLATTLAWDNQIDAANSVLQEMEALDCHNELARALRIRLLRSQQKTAEAFELVNGTNPRNSSQLLEQERFAIDLLLETGNLEAAKDRAAGLAALRLSADTQLNLYELFASLGMTDRASEILDRVRLRPSNSIDVLIDLMQRYDSLEQTDRAKQLAFQILGMAGASSSVYRSQYAMEQALAYLQEIGEARPLVEQYEQLLAQSPNSSVLTQQLLQLYEVCGESQKAADLAAKLEAKQQNSPLQVLVRDGFDQFESMDYEQAHELLLKAIELDGNVLSNISEYLLPLVEEFDSWDRFWQALDKHQVNPFREMDDVDSLRLSLFENKQYSRFESALLDCVTDLRSSDALQGVGQLASQEHRIGTELLVAVTRQLLKQQSEWADAHNLIGTEDYDPDLPGFFTFVDKLAQNPTASQAAFELLKARRESPGRSFLKLALQLEQGRTAECQRFVDNILARDEQTTTDLQVLLFHACHLMGRQPGTPERSTASIRQGLDLCERMLGIAKEDADSLYAQQRPIIVACKQFALEKLGEYESLISSWKEELIDRLRQEAGIVGEDERGIEFAGYGGSYSGYGEYYGSYNPLREKLTAYASMMRQKGELLDAFVAELANSVFEASPPSIDTLAPLPIRSDSTPNPRSSGLKLKYLPPTPVSNWAEKFESNVDPGLISQLESDVLARLAIHLASMPGLEPAPTKTPNSSIEKPKAAQDIAADLQRWHQILNTPATSWPSAIHSAPLSPSLQFIVGLQGHEEWKEAILPTISEWLANTTSETAVDISQQIHRILLAEMCGQSDQSKSGWSDLLKRLGANATAYQVMEEESASSSSPTNRNQNRSRQQLLDSRTLETLTAVIVRLRPDNSEELLRQAIRTFQDRATPLSLLASGFQAQRMGFDSSSEALLQSAMTPLLSIDEESANEITRNEDFLGSRDASWFVFDDEERLTIGLELSILAAHNELPELAMDYFSKTIDKIRFIDSDNYYGYGGRENREDILKRHAVCAARSWLIGVPTTEDDEFIPSPRRLSRRKLYFRLRDYILPPENENLSRNLLRSQATSFDAAQSVASRYQGRADSLAFVLADLATACGVVGDLQKRIEVRGQMPGTAATALAIEARLLDQSVHQKQKRFLKTLMDEPERLVATKHHQTAIAAILHRLDAITSDSERSDQEPLSESILFRNECIEFLLRIVKQHHRDETASELTSYLSGIFAASIRDGDLDDFKKSERWLRELTPSEDRQQYENESRLPMLESAAISALLLGHEDLALQAIAMSLNVQRYAINSYGNSTQFPMITSPDHAAGIAFLAIPPEKRVASLWQSIWNLPDIGLRDYSNTRPSNLGNWYRSALETATSQAISNCLLTQLLEDQLRLGNTEEIQIRLASLKDEDVSFAARIALAVALERFQSNKFGSAKSDHVDEQEWDEFDSVARFPSSLSRIPRLKDLLEEETTTAELEAWRLARSNGNTKAAEDFEKRAMMQQRILGWSNAADFIRAHQSAASIHADSNLLQEPPAPPKWTNGATSFHAQHNIELGERSIRIGSGQGRANLVYTAPLPGDFELRFRLTVKQYADAFVSFAGLTVQVDASYGYVTASAPEQSYYDYFQIPQAKAGSLPVCIKRNGEQLHVSVGNQTFPSYTVPEDASPWLSLGLQDIGQANFNDIEIKAEDVAPQQIPLLESNLDGWSKSHSAYDLIQLLQLHSAENFGLVPDAFFNGDLVGDLEVEETEWWTIANNTLSIAATTAPLQHQTPTAKQGTKLSPAALRDSTMLARSHRFLNRALNVDESVSWETTWQSSSGFTKADVSELETDQLEATQVICLLGDLVISRVRHGADDQGGWQLSRLLPPGQMVELSPSEMDSLMVESVAPKNSLLDSARPGVTPDSLSSSPNGGWHQVQVLVEPQTVRLILDESSELILRRKPGALPMLGFGITGDWNLKVRNLVLNGAW